MSQIIIKNQSFDFIIIYDESSNSINICAIHKVEFFKWETTLSNSLKGNLENDIAIKISPKKLYTLFKEYSENKLNEIFNIVLPITFKNEKIAITRPSISDLEIEYVQDAIKNGWGPRCYDYINRFEGVVHWNGEQILDWYNGQTAAQPGSKT